MFDCPRWYSIFAPTSFPETNRKGTQLAKKVDFKSFLIAKLRAASRKWPAFSEAKKKAKVGVTTVFCEDDMTLTATPDNGDPSFTIKVYKKAQNRERVAYKCAYCGKLFFDYEYLPVLKGKNKGVLKKTAIVALDHRIPIVDPTTGFEVNAVTGEGDWTTYIMRLFFGELQVLCNYPGERNGTQSCHHIKTAQEKAVEAERRRKEKGKH